MKRKNIIKVLFAFIVGCMSMHAFAVEFTLEEHMRKDGRISFNIIKGENDQQDSYTVFKSGNNFLIIHNDPMEIDFKMCSIDKIQKESLDTLFTLFEQISVTMPIKTAILIFGIHASPLQKISRTVKEENDPKFSLYQSLWNALAEWYSKIEKKE